MGVTQESSFASNDDEDKDTSRGGLLVLVTPSILPIGSEESFNGTCCCCCC